MLQYDNHLLIFQCQIVFSNCMCYCKLLVKYYISSHVLLSEKRSAAVFLIWRTVSANDSESYKVFEMEIQTENQTWCS